jgi:hypothetical protein
MALGWLSLLVILPLAVAAAERIVAKVSGDLPRSSTRMGWYFRSEQWLADVRTFTAACQFMMAGDMDAPRRDNSPTNPAVGNASIEAAFQSNNRSQFETGVN